VPAVDASIPADIDAHRYATVAISIVVVVIVIQIRGTIAVGRRIVAVSAWGIGITVDARLAVAIVPIAGPSRASGKTQKAQ